jgi:hypothetical protein
MTKKLSIAGLVVAAAASSAFAFGAAPAKAACLPTDPSATCATFDPTSASNVELYTSFSGTSTTGVYDRVRVLFRLTGFTNNVFDISNIKLEGQGLPASPGFTFADVTTSATGFPTGPTPGGATVAYTLPSSINAASTTLDFANNKLTFTFPSGIATAGDGSRIRAYVNYFDSNDSELISQTSGNPFDTTVTSGPPVPTPGPISILGAGAAFGFSRCLRRRITQSV